MTTIDTTDLTAAEADLLAIAEEVIERGMATFIEVGDALGQVRKNKLYRATHSTFWDYCRERWNMSDSRARQLIGAAETVTNVTEAGHPAPANEGQARALNAVPEDQRAEVWAETLDRTGGKPTAAAVAETVKTSPVWKCAGCGEVSARVRAPKACPTCSTPAFSPLADYLLRSVPNDDYRPVFILRRWDGEEHHQVTAPGVVSGCGISTIGGHVLPVGVLVEKYGSKPCATCWPPAAPAADRRWECWGCAHTWTAPPDPGRDVAACPKCGVQHPVNLGPAADDDADDADDEEGDEPDEVISSHCTSCGNVVNLETTPPYCDRCGVAPAQIKTGLTADTPGHDVVDGRCLTCAPLDNPGELVYIPAGRDGVAYHRLRGAGKETCCGALTKYGITLTRRRVHAEHAGQPCGVCWPGAAGVTDAVRLAAAEEFAAAQAGDTTVAEPSCPKSCKGCDVCVQFVAAAREAQAENGDSDGEPPAAGLKHCEKCGHLLEEESALMGYLRCDGCDDQGDHVSIDGGPCLVCFPDGRPAVTVWMAADRRGLAYHRLQEHAPWTGCARQIEATGRVMARAEAVDQIGGKPCRACYPGGDPDPVVTEPPAVEPEPAPPVLEGEVVDSAPEQTIRADDDADPAAHFARLVAVCEAFNDAFDDEETLFLPAALLAFDPARAHHIARTVHNAGWLTEFLANAAAAAAAPDTAGQLPGQMDLLGEAVPDADE